MSMLSIKDRHAYVSNDLRAAVEYSPRPGEMMCEYLDRLCWCASCGDDDAKAALEGVFQTGTFRAYASRLSTHAVLH